MMTDIMMEGTQNKTPEELEEELELLGANIWMYRRANSIKINGDDVAKNYEKNITIIFSCFNSYVIII